jgi:pimeloyl-ACP methyl ester carboxylesterase
MSSNEMSHGTFKNGIPYLRFGSGAKTMLFLAGGPGNLVPKGLGASGFVRGMKPFAQEYTIYLVTRKSGLPEGYTTKNMSDDYAELIRAEFGGHVDMVLGASFGGMIAQHFAADHADLFDHLVIVMAAHKVTDEAKNIDIRYAELLSQHKDRAAMASRAGAAFNGVVKYIATGLLWIFGKTLLGSVSDTFRKDVVIEAKAEVAHESVESLKRINVPVLLVGGDTDFAFPVSYMNEMAALIKQSTLKIYKGGHTAAFMDKRFIQDVRAFAN